MTKTGKGRTKPEVTPKPKTLTAQQKRVRNAELISNLAKGGKDFVSGGNTPISTSANDSNPAEWKAEPAVNQTKEQLTTDLEKKSPKSFLSNYSDIA